MADWKQIVATVAPELATLFGTPLAGAAVAALSQKFLGHTNGTEDEISAAVASASPDVLAKIKETEAKLKTDMLNAGVQWEQIAAGDRASARQREMTTRDWMVPTLALIYTFLYFLALWAVWKFGLPPESDTKAELTTLLGIITTAQIAIMTYYFGSSAGSDKKNDIIRKALE